MSLKGHSFGFLNLNMKVTDILIIGTILCGKETEERKHKYLYEYINKIQQKYLYK